MFQNFDQNLFWSFWEWFFPEYDLIDISKRVAVWIDLVVPKYVPVGKDLPFRIGTATAATTTAAARVHCCWYKRVPLSADCVRPCSRCIRRWRPPWSRTTLKTCLSNPVPEFGLSLNLLRYQSTSIFKIGIFLLIILAYKPMTKTWCALLAI